MEDYKDSHMFLSKLKKDKEFGKKKHTHTHCLNSVGVVTDSKNSALGFGIHPKIPAGKTTSTE